MRRQFKTPGTILLPVQILKYHKKCSSYNRQSCNYDFPPVGPGNGPPIGGRRCCDGGGNNALTDYLECELVGSANNPVWVWGRCPGGTCISAISASGGGSSGSDTCSG
jgi:hypothetical protein